MLTLSPPQTRLCHKILAVLLAAALLLPVSLPSAFAAQEESGDPSPIIYIIGRTTIYDDPASPNRKILAKGSSEEIMAAVKEALPYAAKALLLGQWDAYSDKAYDLIMQFFDGYCCDENGEVVNGSGIGFSWSEDRLSHDYKSNNPYTYRFEYDARLSPLEVADDLHTYIEAVRRVTGRDKVSLIGRCLGTNILMAYVQKYEEPTGFAGLDTAVMYDSSFLGIDALESAMSGTVKIEPDAAGEFLTDFDLNLDNDTLNAILPLTLRMLQETYGIEITAQVAQHFYSQIKYRLIHRFLMNTFGTTPGYWSMVYDHYDEAKAYLFNQKGDAEKYAGLIAKLDEYRSNVQLRYEEIISGMLSSGVEVAAVCKYGFRGYPVYAGANALTDAVTTVKKQSFGAACSDFDGTLAPSYLQERTEKGFGDYISPDRQIDASAGLLPDTTWYIKNNDHNNFWDCMNPLLNAICRKKDFTVKDDGNWPQYLYLMDRSTVVPMTEENCDPHGQITHEGSANSFKNPFKAVWNFFKYIFELLKVLFGAAKK